MTGGWMVGAQWLEGWKSLYCPPGRWLVNARWLVAGDRACPVVGDRACPVGQICLLVYWTSGRWWPLTTHARWMVGQLWDARWPLAIGWWTCTPLGTSTHWVATNMGLTPGQQGHKGQCSHVFFSFHLMKQTHLEPSFCSIWLSSGRVSSSLFCKFPDGIRPAATRGASRFPGTMIFYDYSNAILYDHNHRNE